MDLPQLAFWMTANRTNDEIAVHTTSGRSMVNKLDRVREEGGFDLAVIVQEAQSFLRVAKLAAPRGGALWKSDSSAVEGDRQPFGNAAPGSAQPGSSGFRA